MQNDFPIILKQLMSEKNISKNKLSQMVDVAGSTVTGWVNGSFLPKRDKLESLAKVLNVTSNYLIGIKEKDRHDDIANFLRNRSITELEEKILRQYFSIDVNLRKEFLNKFIFEK